MVLYFSTWTLWRLWRFVFCGFYSARSYNFAEYWKHFMARLNGGVHAFGYNCAGSEPIWMKFGALWVAYIACRWPRQILGAIRAESRARERSEFFCQVNNARLYLFPIRQISRTLHTRRGSESWWILSDENFESLPARGLFIKRHIFR